MRVKATDLDMGDNARLRYDLTVETMRDFGHLFDVEPDTGEIYTRARLDYETRAEYPLYVIARDGGGNDVASGNSNGGGDESLSNQVCGVQFVCRIVCELLRFPRNLKLPHEIKERPNVG